MGKHFNVEKTREEVDFITSQLDASQPILDLGCGTGRHMIPLLKKGYTVVGMDNSQGMLDILKKKLEKNNLQAELINKDILKIKKLDTIFGGVICFWNAFCEIATSVDDALVVLKTLYDSLEKKGKLIMEISDPETFDPKKLDFESTIEKDNQVYETSFKTIDFDEKTNITTSQEIITIRENDKIIKRIESEFVQKWWHKQEIENFCKQIGFSQVEFFDSISKKSRNDLIVVATK